MIPEALRSNLLHKSVWLAEGTTSGMRSLYCPCAHEVSNCRVRSVDEQQTQLQPRHAFVREANTCQVPNFSKLRQYLHGVAIVRGSGHAGGM